jgi:hypothetical protein
MANTSPPLRVATSAIRKWTTESNRCQEWISPVAGIGRLIVEPPHFTSGLLAREGFLGPEFLFGQGFIHASVGYSHFRQRILDPNPGFEVLVNGQPAPSPPPPPAPPLWEPYTDREIIADFARALRQNPYGLVGSIEKVYVLGFSDSGDAVRRILEAEYGQNLFDLWFPGTIAPFNPIEGRGQVIVFNTEADFQPVNAVSPSYRRYVAAGCPHIPDIEFTRQQFPGPFPPPVTGTTPLNWNPFMRALFVAGDSWVTEGQEPPPSTVLELTPSGEIARDEKGNARGGIRHPALELGEGHFIASQNISGWTLFGGYDQVSSIGDAGFFTDFNSYKVEFGNAAKALCDAGFLLKDDEKNLRKNAKLMPPFTFTQNYQAGRFVP